MYIVVYQFKNNQKAVAPLKKIFKFKKMLTFAKQFKQISVLKIMKKGLSIFLSLLMLAAILHLSVATHYCSGKETGSRISLTAKLADCGMEGSEKRLPLPGIHFTNHCCDDVVIFCGIDNNFVPSFSFIPESYQYNFQVLAIPVALSVNSYTVLIPLYTNVSPPDELMSTSVDLSDICIFRI